MQLHDKLKSLTQNNVPCGFFNLQNFMEKLPLRIRFLKLFLTISMLL